ncbi:MAG TPA: hypothetical protein VF137_10950 [Candidatus Dormibacteraeota bacterium]
MSRTSVAAARSVTPDRGPLGDRLLQLTAPVPLLIGALVAAMLAGAATALGSVWVGAVLALLVAPWFVVLAIARPAWVLTAVLTLAPFDPLFFGELQKLGAAHDLVSMMRFWKEFAILALGVAAIVRGTRALDGLDLLALALVAIIAAYLLLPLGPPADVRLVAARQDGFLVLIFVIVRHLPLGPPERRLLALALLLEGAVTTATGLWNVFDAAGWGNFLASAGVLDYQGQQAGGSASVELVYSLVGGRYLLHASGFFFSSLSFGFFMLVPFGIAASRVGLAPGRALRALSLLIAAAGTMLSLTRTAIFAMFAMAVTAVMLANRRIVALTAGAFLALVLVPLAAAIGLGDRLGTTLSPSDVSSTIHLDRLGQDATALLVSPLGHGLGTAASTGERFAVAGAVIQESWYFQIGFEMGLVAFILVVLFVVTCLLRLARGALAGDGWSQAGLLGLGATATCAIFLHTFDAIGVAWPVWSVVAIGCSFVPSARGQAPDSAAR